MLTFKRAWYEQKKKIINYIKVALTVEGIKDVVMLSCQAGPTFPGM